MYYGFAHVFNFKLDHVYYMKKIQSVVYALLLFLYII